MDIQARKLNLIEYLITLKDERILNKIETTIFGYSKSESKDFKPLTKKQLLKRAKKSNDDFVAGRYKTQEQLEHESTNW